MLKIKYPFDGENPNTDLEDLIVSEVEQFDLCGDDFEDTDDGGHLRVLEFEGENADEQAFIGSETAQTLQEIVGMSIPLEFEFEPWDEDEEVAAPTAPAPRSSAASSDKNIYFLGHCTIGTSDKIWGAVKAQGEWFTFWGARKNKLMFKRSDEYSNHASLDTLVRSKRKKGYLDTTIEELNRLDPEFETRFEEELILCLMADKFHHA
jgi:hypothetical protein